MLRYLLLVASDPVVARTLAQTLAAPAPGFTVVTTSPEQLTANALAEWSFDGALLVIDESLEWPPHAIALRDLFPGLPVALLAAGQTTTLHSQRAALLGLPIISATLTPGVLRPTIARELLRPVAVVQPQPRPAHLLEGQLWRLLHQTHGRGAAVVGGDGKLLGHVADWQPGHEIDLAALAALAAADLRATQRLARAFGQRSGTTITIHDHGEQILIVASDSAGQALLLVLDEGARLGPARQAVRQTFAALVPAVEAAPTHVAAAPHVQVPAR